MNILNNSIKRRFKHLINKNYNKTFFYKTFSEKNEESEEVKKWLNEDLPRSTDEQTLPMPWTDEYKDIIHTNY
jgi:hypothetical protein